MQPTDPDDDDILTPREVTRLLGISARTLDNYVEEGRVTCRRLPSGHRRFRRGDVMALLTQRSA